MSSISTWLALCDIHNQYLSDSEAGPRTLGSRFGSETDLPLSSLEFAISVGDGAGAVIDTESVISWSAAVPSRTLILPLQVRSQTKQNKSKMNIKMLMMRNIFSVGDK